MDWKETLDQLERGTVRAASPLSHGGTGGEKGWAVNIAVKEAILEAFKAGKNVVMDGVHAGYIDKDTLLPQQFDLNRGVRIVPTGSAVRRGAYVASGVIIMPPSYINVGAYIDSGTMVDSHVLVGSCAQIGKKVHLSAGVQIGGVLEPIGEHPVIIEDEAFIGAGAVIVEGVRVGARAVIAPGVVLSKSIPVYDLVNGCLLPKNSPIPEDAVVVPGSRPVKSGWAAGEGLHLQCALIIKYRDAKTEKSLVLEDLLR